MHACTFIVFYVGVLVASNAENIVCGVSEPDSKIIVEEHNKYRLMVAKGQVPGQPKGVNLKRIAWDKKLADSAQEVANLSRSEELIYPDGRFSVGQNMLYLTCILDFSTAANWTKVIKGWYDEHLDYTFGKKNSEQLKTNHYTQIVSADTHLVGCGYCCIINKAEKHPKKKLYVCNYGPGGNYGGSPYQTGDSGCENLC